jgi:RHS repeat-associated protein
VLYGFPAAFDVLAYHGWNTYPLSFEGTLLDDKHDQGGTWYRRNRSYDPASGRFTQEDPIGLAGGMNLYGFGAGDPINHSDPFGLCPKSAGGDGKTEEMSDCPAGTSGWYANRIANGTGNQVLNEVGGTLATCSESLLCQAVLTVASLGTSLVEGAAAKGGIAAVRAGQAGEAAVGAAENIGSKVAIRVAGRTRIPDGMTGSVLTEVKNVRNLSFTRQLRDYAQYAQSNGLRFDLWVRSTTRLSGPLQDAITSGVVNLRIIP